MAKSTKPWTAARRKAFIVSVLRAGTRRWPPKYETLNAAKTEKKINKRTKRLAQHYLCAICEDEFPATNVQVDHIIPVVDPVKGFKDWNTFIKRLFCEASNLQTVCKECHKRKTKEENIVN
jgi:5-methylcytosine-specific restriction endonuclease McrA